MVLIGLSVLMLADTAGAYPHLFGFRARNRIPELNAKLAGRVHDYTANHGADRRLFSPALRQPRDIYVYTPPGYDGVAQFPVMLFLHGLGQDEKIFLDVIPKFDDAIRAGTAAPMIIVVPDGSVDGEPKLRSAGSFFINSHAGRFGDYIVQDVWPWVLRSYACRPERAAHCICGASMGGFAAYNIAFKNKGLFEQVIGIMPPLNLRYGDCHGRYLGDYDPNCFKLREINRRNEIVGRFYGVLLIRSRRMLDPIVGSDYKNATQFVSQENPYEMLSRLAIRPEEFNLFIGYGKEDEFNIDAEVESFLAEAARLGIFPTTILHPRGRHSVQTAVDMIPALNQWLFDKFQPYAPPDYRAPTLNVFVRPVVAIRPLAGITLAGWEFPASPPVLP